MKSCIGPINALQPQLGGWLGKGRDTECDLFGYQTEIANLAVDLL